MKKVVVLLVILAVLAMAAVLLLPRYLNPERYRPQIEAALERATGWEVTLGEIKVRVFGGTSIRIKPVELSDPASGFRTEVGSLRIRAELKPLLQGRLVVRKVEVVEPAITLLWTADGLQLPSTPKKTAKSPGHPPTSAEPEGSTPRVTVSKIVVRDGSLKLLHQVPGAPSVWTLSRVNGTILPGRGKLSLSGRAGQGGASLTMSHEGPATVAVENLGVADVPPWLVQDLVQPGGVLSGTLKIGRSGKITGKLAARRLAFLDGSQPLKKVDLELSISPSSDRWTLNGLRLEAAGATLRGSGTLAPRLELRLELEPSPVEAALAVARSLHPVPIVVKGPGQAQGTARIRRNGKGAITASAKGMLSAALLRLTDGLPPIRQAGATFHYGEDGTLTISPAGGVFAGGRLKAKLHLAPLTPPGALSLHANLQGANLRQLLLDLGIPHARRFSGSLVAKAGLTTDLSTGVPGPAGLEGKIVATVNDLEVPGWDLVATITDQLGRGGSWKDMLNALNAPKKKRSKGKASFDLARVKLVMDGLPWKLSSLELRSPELEATGSGTFDPVQGSVRVRLDVHLNEALSKKLLDKASFLSSLRDSSGRLVIPTTVRGPVTDPSISVDLESVLGGGKGYGGLLDSLLGGKH